MGDNFLKIGTKRNPATHSNVQYGFNYSSLLYLTLSDRF